MRAKKTGLRQQVLTGLALGASRDRELGLAAALWPPLPAASLVLLARECAASALSHQLGDPTRPRHWLPRARTGPLAVRRRVVMRVGPGAALGQRTPSLEARRVVRPGARDLPPTLRVRASRDRRRGFRPGRSSPHGLLRGPPPPPRRRTLPRPRGARARLRRRILITRACRHRHQAANSD